MPWQEIEHTADWALRVWAPTLPELFAEAARGMYALAGASAPPPAAAPITHTFTFTTVDTEALLVSWLQELLYFTEAEQLVFYAFTLSALTPTTLTASATGYVSPRLAKVIKAVTYHNLQVQATPAGFETTLVFDV